MTKEDYILDCWSKAEDYCYGVENGTILCNDNIRRAVERHKRDVSRSDLEYRKESVERVFKFFSYIFIDRKTQFILQPFQAFIILALFGLYFKGTNERKYLQAFLFIGAKNGKTTFSAALILYLMMADGASFPEALLILGSKDQTKDTSFHALDILISSSPVIERRLRVTKGLEIYFRKDEYGKEKIGKIKVMSGIPDKSEGLNPTSCVLDEVHTWKGPEKYNVIKDRLGTKPNPLLFLISTAGFGKDSFCAQLVETGRNVLRGISTDDRFFYLLYELEEGDDYQDPNLWIKANPGLGTILNSRTFRDSFNTVKTIPSTLGDFMTKRLNIFLEEQSEWIPSNILLPCFKNFTEDDIKDLPCYLGIDLSETRDLTSIVCLWSGKDKFYVRPYFFFVKGESNSLRKGGVDINQWIKEGLIIECSTPTMDYELLKSYLFDLRSKYDVKGLFYDPWHFKRIADTPKDSKGISLVSPDGKQHIWCKPVIPGTRSFDYPMRFVESLFYDNNVNVYNNRCMFWNFLNMVVMKDMNGNLRPDKNKKKDAIDGVVALLNAVYGYVTTNASSAAKFMNALKTND